jgi:hypothetical protein
MSRVRVRSELRRAVAVAVIAAIGATVVIAVVDRRFQSAV